VKWQVLPHEDATWMIAKDIAKRGTTVPELILGGS